MTCVLNGITYEVIIGKDCDGNFRQMLVEKEEKNFSDLEEAAQNYDISHRSELGCNPYMAFKAGACFVKNKFREMDLPEFASKKDVYYNFLRWLNEECK